MHVLGRRLAYSSLAVGASAAIANTFFCRQHKRGSVPVGTRYYVGQTEALEAAAQEIPQKAHRRDCFPPTYLPPSREEMIAKMKKEKFDVLVIGGGASGDLLSPLSPLLLSLLLPLTWMPVLLWWGASGEVSCSFLLLKPPFGCIRCTYARAMHLMRVVKRMTHGTQMHKRTKTRSNKKLYTYTCVPLHTHMNIAAFSSVCRCVYNSVMLPATS